MIRKLIVAIIITCGFATSALGKTVGFVISGVTSSTSSSQHTNEPIEPAFGDSVTYHWQQFAKGKLPRAIALYREFNKPGPNRIKFRKGNATKYYEKIAQSEALMSSLGPKTGECSWPSKDGAVYRKTFPAGRHRVGIVYGGTKGYELTDLYVDVQLTVYDVSTSGTLYIGDNAARVEYYLSSEAVGPKSVHSKKPGKVKINMAKDSFVYGPGKAGKNLSAPWDGTTSKGEYIDGGSTAISLKLTPVADNPVPKNSVGANLKIANVKCVCDATKKNTFVPDLGQKLRVSFDLSEPVARPQAKSAEVTARICDEDGRFIRLLLNGESEIDGVPVKINNLTKGHTGGRNEFVWDGKDERGDIVDSGNYQITIFAEDNCGVGCESNAVVTTAIVDYAPTAAELALSWPEDICALPEGMTALPEGVPGYTDSGNPVYASIDDAPEFVAREEKDLGMFFLDIVKTPGLHSVKLRTKSSKFPEKTLTVPYFINEYGITNPKIDERFGGRTNLPIIFTSKWADLVDIAVSDPFDLSTLYDADSPVPAAEKLNAFTTVNKIRSLTGPDGLAIASGQTTIEWDGKDDAGVFVKPGVYDIVITRRNTDKLLDIDAHAPVVIADENGPKIANVKAEKDGSVIKLSWTTDVPANCYVVSGGQFDRYRKFRANSAGSAYSLCIPNSIYADGTAFNIIAESKSDGAVSISEKKLCSPGNSFGVETRMPRVLSETTAEVSASPAANAFAAVEYARIDGDLSKLKWKRIEQKKRIQGHVFNLSGLLANSEYAYRIICSENADWSESSITDYQSFVTKKKEPSIAFVGVADGQGFWTLDKVTVKASDTHPRFSKHGITKIELLLDGEPITTYKKRIENNCLIYDFDLSSVKKHNGVNDLTAVATDDYWETSSSTIQVLLSKKPSQTDAKSGN